MLGVFKEITEKKVLSGKDRRNFADAFELTGKVKKITWGFGVGMEVEFKTPYCEKNMKARIIDPFKEFFKEEKVSLKCGLDKLVTSAPYHPNTLLIDAALVNAAFKIIGKNENFKNCELEDKNFTNRGFNNNF